MTCVELHVHRKQLVGAPEKRLEKLMRQVCLKVYEGDLLKMSDDYASEKAGETIKQLLNRGFIDRAELYEHLIRWCALKLQEVRT